MTYWLHWNLINKEIWSLCKLGNWHVYQLLVPQFTMYSICLSLDWPINKDIPQNAVMHRFFLYLFCTQFPIFAPLGHRYQKRDSGKGLWLLGGAYVYSFDRCMLFRTFMTCSFPHRFPCGYCLLAPTVLIARGRKNKHQKTRRLQW